MTSAVIDTGRLNESATRPVTPAISSILVSVTQSAGNIAGWSLRRRAVTSSAAAAEPTTRPVIQPTAPRPAVADTIPSTTAVASIPSSAASQMLGSPTSATGLSAG